MSGLYNLLFKQNDKTEFLLNLLGKTRGDFCRFRDVYVTDTAIVVHTRCGGGNREEYADFFDEMAGHPLYIEDRDEDFDSTYANIYFSHPEEYKELLAEMAKGTVTPSEKWQKLFVAFGSSPIAR